MKHLLSLVVVFLLSLQAYAGSGNVSATTVNDATASLEAMTTMSVAEYEAATGEKMNLIQKMKFKAAKKQLAKKEQAADISKGVYVLLALVGLGWLGIGLLADFGGSAWIISLVLYLLFWLPGLIYTLIKMKDFY